MVYPTINDYLTTVSNHDRLFRTLNITSRRDKYGEVVFISGNHAVVFKADTPEGCIALKCYTRRVDDLRLRYEFINKLNTPYVKRYNYLEDEIFIYHNDLYGEYFPVLTSQWIEGTTLIRHLRKLCTKGDTKELSHLSVSFDRMALWLLAQNFAHGDLKHDNILMDEQGELCLIDFDGAFIPTSPELKSTTIGSPAFQHPNRESCPFDRNIDDYSIAIISLSLHALKTDPSLLAKYHDTENIIFNATEVQQNQSNALHDIRQMWFEAGYSKLIALSNILHNNEVHLEGLHELISAISGSYQPVIDNSYEIIDSSNISIIRKAGLYGYADTETGMVIIGPIYKEAKPFTEGFAAVNFNHKWYYINPKGQCTIKCNDYTYVEPFREGMARIEVSGKYGFINCDAEQIIPPIYQMATSFRDGISHVKSKGVWFSIDKENHRVSECTFDSIDELKKTFM